MTRQLQLCPYCGREFRQVGHHIDHCLSRPEIWKATAIALDDGTGHIKSLDSYSLRSPGQAVSRNTLVELFGNWDRVAKTFGLRPSRNQSKGRVRNYLDHALAAEGEQLDEDREVYRSSMYGSGVPVCRCRQGDDGRFYWLVR